MMLPLLLLFAVTAAAQTKDFVKDIYPLLQKADCMGCHNLNGVASTTRLIFPEKGAPDDELMAFGESLRMLVDRSAPDQSLLLTKPTNRVQHGGGVRIQPGGPEEASWKVWVRYLAETQAAVGTKRKFTRRPGERTVLRRLTHSQYDNTVADLLGDRTLPSKQFPTEDYIDGFKNQYEGQSISPILAENYASAAERLAANWSGKDSGPPFVHEFGKRAFRRPLTTEESKRYGALYARGGARMVIEGMLQSPAFLFRMETTANPEHKGYARASRLAYLLWDTMPDAELFTAAEQGQLDNAAAFEAQARRMLSSPRSRAAIEEFVAQWLRFDTIVTMVKERRAFPLFTRELALAMIEETRRLTGDLIWNNTSFMDLYTANYTYLNADLATLYGLPAPAEEFAKVNLPDASERAGLLGHASILALTAKPGETSITARGLFVREHLLCQQVPPPPPGLNASLPVQKEDKPMTNRELLATHLVNPSCASCHNLVDPIGYGLEKYDGIGARREKMVIPLPRYNRREDVKTVDLAIDAAGWVTGIQNSNFTSPRELGRVLAANPQCQECIVKQYFRYAMGRHEMASDRAVIERVTEDFRRSGFRFVEMVVSLVKWTEFPPQAVLAETRQGRN